MNKLFDQLKSWQSLFILGAGLLVFFGVVALLWTFTDQPAVPEHVVSATASVAPQPGVTDSSAMTPTSPGCPDPPAGWQLYTIQAGDSLRALAGRIGISQNRLIRANCLDPDVPLQSGQQIYLPVSPTPTPCRPTSPTGWTSYTVQAGDTLLVLAQASSVTADRVIAVNCLDSTNIRAGDTLILPPFPTPTPCRINPPADWVLETIRSGDTIFDLARLRRTTTQQIMQVNCLNSPTIRIGETLYLPALPTPTPTLTPTSLPPTPTFAPLLALGPTTVPRLPQESAAGLAAELNEPGPPANTGQQPGQGSGAGSASPPATIINVINNPFDSPSVRLVTAPPPNYSEDDEKLFGTTGCSTSLKKVGVVRREVVLGDRLYFLTCNFFPNSAVVTRSDELTRPINVYSVSAWNHPEFNLYEQSTASAVLEWIARPADPLGVYTLTVTGDTPQPLPPLTYTVRYTDDKKILPVPLVSFPGDIFEIYYLNFPVGREAAFNIWYAPGFGATGQPVGRISVMIDRKFQNNATLGWGRNLLVSQRTNLTGTYVISQVGFSAVQQKIRLR